jgi:dipeptidyl aminopeptidase/acylaminoacyl peptidase
VDEDGEPWSELWMIEAAGGSERPFVIGKVNVQGIEWLPDGSGVAFLAKREGDSSKSLYIIPLHGGEARKALALRSDISGFSFSPDGAQVALVSPEPEPEERKKLKDKGFKQEIYEEDWRFSRVWIGTPFDPAGTNIPPIAITGSIRQVRWSPGGDLLAVAVTPTPSVDDNLMRRQLWVVDATTNATVRARVEHVAKLADFRWSPDGTRLAFIAGEDIHDPSPGRLMVVTAEGGRPRNLVPRLEAEVTHLEWLNEEELIFAADKGVLSLIGRIAAGSQSGVPTNVYGPSHPIITGLSLSTGGGMAAIAGHTATHPTELFTLLGQDPEFHRRTESNPWLKEMRFARQESIRYRARDGLDVEGVLIHPLDRQEVRRYPLILGVHGGPEAHISDGWLTSYSLPGQVAAARGFAVFYPNYRGSTGRGVAFSKLGQGDAAGREFDDLVDSVDHLVSGGLADRAKVGVTGGSYGGYATAWCSTRFSERFAAGVMFVGISDKISKVGTTDIPDEEYYVHALKRPWEAWQFLLERSPIFHAGNSRTPLLILHGADDPRVHPGQSRELHRHLKLRSRAPVRLVLYPGEGHGNRKAGARYDYNLRMLRWFEHYLKGTGGSPPPIEVDYGFSREDSGENP